MVNQRGTTTEHLEWLLQEGLRCERGDLPRARALAQEALALSETLSNPSLRARAQRNSAYILYAEGEQARANALLQRALQQAEENDDTSAAALCLHTQGFFSHHAGRLLEALDSYLSAAAHREALGEHALLAGTLNNLGATYLNLGDYDACLKAHQKALRLWRSTGNRFGEAFTLNNIGITYGVFDDFASALHYHYQAAAVAEELNNTLLLCEVNTLIARALRRHGDSATAWQHLQYSKQLAETLDEPRCRAHAQEEEGQLLTLAGDFPGARQCLCQALCWFRRMRSQVDVTRLLYAIGLLHRAQGRQRSASATLQRCRHRAQVYGLKQMERDACGALADAFEEQDNTRAALAFHRQFHRLDRELIDEIGERQRLLLLRQIELEKAQQETERERLRNQELAEAHRRLEEANVLLTELATRDGMTGLINHRSFQEQLRHTLDPDRPQETALLLIDVDRFKDYNDTFGHPAGDAVLKQVAELLRQCVRDQDQIARYGGEEFAVLLPGADTEIAQTVAERIRQAVSQYLFPFRQVTVSIGVTTTRHSGTDPTRLIHDADQALYAAKHAGRNRSRLAA